MGGVFHSPIRLPSPGLEANALGSPAASGGSGLVPQSDAGWASVLTHIPVHRVRCPEFLL